MQLSEVAPGVPMTSLPQDGVVLQISQDLPPQTPRYLVSVSAGEAALPGTAHGCANCKLTGKTNNINV